MLSRSGLNAAEMMRSTNPPLSGKLNESEIMRGLNDRLAGFIEKVRGLERHNHLLEVEIGEFRKRVKPASCLEEEYGLELDRLRRLVQETTHQKHQLEIDHRDLEEELSSARAQCARETQSRSGAENNIVVLKKDISDAYRAKLQLDKKAQSLVDEINFLKARHEAEASEMRAQIQDAQALHAEAHEFGHPGVTAALRDIRTQLGHRTASDVQHTAGESFRAQFARLTEAAEAKRDALKASQQEIQEYRRRLQAKSIELDCAAGTREALEKQLHDEEDRHKEEMIHYQNTIQELENELINCKFDMSGYLREYQDLLNVKMALDVEILSYRKLLCGEEARLSTISDPNTSLPHIYHQSPVYNLPCFSRPGGPQRRAEPQYKFVEEIITETTREIEMSEFEDTGSEGTEVGKEEQDCSKSERGASEEKSGHQDSREDERNQVLDSQQVQVVGECEKKEDKKDLKDAGEVASGDKSHDVETNQSTQNKLSSSENLDKKGDEKYETAGNTDETQTAENIKREPKIEDDKPAEEKCFARVPDRKTEEEMLAKVPESFDNVQQPRDEVNLLFSETPQKATEVSAETQSSLSKDVREYMEDTKATFTILKEGDEKLNLKQTDLSEADTGNG